ncbi:hypothetical protein ACTPEU_00195, partial [Clostridioides difficile]
DTKTELNKIDLPIKKGAKVGTLNVYNNGKLENSIDLIAKNNLFLRISYNYFLVHKSIHVVL